MGCVASHPSRHQDGRGGPGARGWALELGALRSPEARHSLSRAPVRLGGSGPEATCRSDLRGGAGPSWLGAWGVEGVGDAGSLLLVITVRPLC